MNPVAVAAYQMLVSLGAGLGFAFSMSTAEAAPNCGANVVAAENCLAGTPAAEWDVAGAGDPTIQGFATDISVDRGAPVRFKIKTDATSYRIDIYRLGYYDGLGARKIVTLTPSALLPQPQPNCLTQVSTGLIDCGNWAVSATWPVPATAVSGVYLARLVRTDTGGASHIPFVVRNDASHSDLVFQTSDTTWQAYNDYGGNSLYTGAPAGRAYKVSYNRPLVTRGNQYARASLFGAEYPMIRWLEANGYDVTYISGLDSDRNGELIRNHEAYLSVGHDEYWSAVQRANVEAARDAGVNLAFFSGNEMFWKTRWESAIDGSGTPYRTLVTYKETHANAKIDPTPVWTGTWRDPRFSPPADGGQPENAVTGTIFTVNCCRQDSITVPAAYADLRFWRDTSVASLAPGQVATLNRGVLGYEWDESLNNGYRPPGLIRLSSTTVAVSSYLLDHGSNFGPGTATHALTLHRRPSGALVFSAGSVRWSWGLDGTHDFDPATPQASTQPDSRMQQATVNLLADMGAQPSAIQAPLIAAMGSIDTARPSSVISSPSAGSTVQQGAVVTIGGTALDGGGVVAAVEVSIDGGATWRPAVGGATWSFSWTPSKLGPANIRSRAIDDSGNIEVSSASVNVTVAPQSCPCTIWGAATPEVASASDAAAVELGVKFTATTDGLIMGVRFYKGPGNTGVHVGNLWTLNGSLLASATFTNETSSGWQQVSFATPVAISANTTYVVSYHASNGRYAFDAAYFASGGVEAGRLQAKGNGVPGGNGVYAYGVSSSYPSETFNATNYWVDVVFMDGGSTGNDTSAPSIPGNFALTKTSGKPRLTWTASTDNVGVAGYAIHRSTNRTFGSPVAQVTGTSWVDPAVVERVTYTYAVVAIDAAGNRSARTPLRTLMAGAKPTIPTRLTIVVSNGLPTLQWRASTDNVGVAGYIVYRGTPSGSLGPEIGRTGVTRFTDTSAVSGHSYKYAVKAYDAAGYVGGRSNFATVAIP